MALKARELLALSVVLSLSGCAPIETVSTREVMQSWIGKDVDGLFKEEGVPSQIMQYQDEYLVVYRYNLRYQTPGRYTTEGTVTDWGVWLSLQAKTTYYPGTVIDISHSYAFLVNKDGVITHVMWNAPSQQLTEEGKKNFLIDTGLWLLGIIVAMVIIVAIVPQKY